MRSLRRCARYTAETLAVTFRGKTIADVLNLSVAAALELFANVPRIRRILKTLDDVGLGYISLGQAAPTLSGGEAQRVKLAAELARPDTGSTLYILDEPTTGLHFDDVRKLLEVVHRLADLGNTVVVIEHNLEVIKTADWVIDLGPEAGLGGGDLVAEGTPEEIVRSPAAIRGGFWCRCLRRARVDLSLLLQAEPAVGKAARVQEVERGMAQARTRTGARVGRASEGGSGKSLGAGGWRGEGSVGNRRAEVAYARSSRANGRPVRWDGRILERDGRSR